jgi:hypothetical protein
MAFPGTYNFDYYRGDTFRFVVSPKDSTGTAFDLAPYKSTVSPTRDAIFSIADARGVNRTLFLTSHESADLQASIDTSNDTITCTITPDGGRELEGGETYYYDVQINNGGALTYTLLTGTITVQDDVTGAL